MYVYISITHWNVSYWYAVRMRISFKSVTTPYHFIAMCMVHIHIGHAKMVSSAQATSPSEGCSRAAQKTAK